MQQRKQKLKWEWKTSFVPGTWRAKFTKTESIVSAPSDSRELNLRGMWWGRAIRSEPLGISWEATNPRPQESALGAIVTAWWTKPPSLLTHLIRSGGWGTSRPGWHAVAVAVAAAQVRGRNWVRILEAPKPAISGLNSRSPSLLQSLWRAEWRLVWLGCSWNLIRNENNMGYFTKRVKIIFWKY